MRPVSNFLIMQLSNSRAKGYVILDGALIDSGDAGWSKEIVS